MGGCLNALTLLAPGTLARPTYGYTGDVPVAAELFVRLGMFTPWAAGLDGGWTRRAGLGLAADLRAGGCFSGSSCSIYIPRQNISFAPWTLRAKLLGHALNMTIEKKGRMALERHTATRPRNEGSHKIKGQPYSCILLSVFLCNLLVWTAYRTPADLIWC